MEFIKYVFRTIITRVFIGFFGHENMGLAPEMKPFCVSTTEI